MNRSLLSGEQRRKLDTSNDLLADRKTSLTAALRKSCVDRPIDTLEQVEELLGQEGVIREPLLRRDLEAYGRALQANANLLRDLEKRAACAAAGPFRQVRSAKPRV